MKSRLLLQEYEEKILRRFVIYTKPLLFAVRRPHKNTYPLFIQGCGRSGTTMLLNILIRDSRLEVLGENDPKIAKNFMLVKDNIRPAIEHSKAQVLAMKPILNSFEASSLLKDYSRSKIIWMLRDYRDMTMSSIQKFGSSVSDWMKNFVLLKGGNNWLSLGTPTPTLKILSNLDPSGFTDYDWMALVWWSVNHTVILDKLHQNERFLLLRYEDLVGDPHCWLRRVYHHIGLQYRAGASRYIHWASVGKGISIRFHPIVKQMCENLASKLMHLIKG